MKPRFQTAALTIGILLLVAAAVHGSIRDIHQTRRVLPPWDVRLG